MTRPPPNDRLATLLDPVSEATAGLRLSSIGGLLPVPANLPGCGAGTPVRRDDHDPLVQQPAGGRIAIYPCYQLAGFASASPELWLRSDVGGRLTAAAALLPAGYGLAVLDAWRTAALQQELYALAYGHSDLDVGYVTRPSTDPQRPAPHTTGGTVDVTLTCDQVPLGLGTGFDAFTADAHLAAFERPGRDRTVRQLRRLLYHAMSSAGFVGYRQEWWHYEYGTCRWAALTGGRARWMTATTHDRASGGRAGTR